MEKLRRYLCVSNISNNSYQIYIQEDPPLEFLSKAINSRKKLRYSAIFPAYISPDGSFSWPEKTVSSITFYFSKKPYKLLGKLRPLLSEQERRNVYFTQSLASIICLNLDTAKANELLSNIDTKIMEFWPIKDNHLDSDAIQYSSDTLNVSTFEIPVFSPPSELELYVEQILSSVTILSESYSIYDPDELVSLERILKVTDAIIEKYNQISKAELDNTSKALEIEKRRNSIISSLSEICAALSYAVTQGTTGSSPILSNPSPFPHFSLLGIAGAVRGLRKFTRYLESAFSVRDVSEVLKKGYSTQTILPQNSISSYISGLNYKFNQQENSDEEIFDNMGEFPLNNGIPLITYLSLRHGFKESKFTITAAAQTLTSEVSPQWTLITLSHEIMHSRVRTIFQSLFGVNWDSERRNVISPDIYRDFDSFMKSGKIKQPIPINSAIRSVILNYCCAMERASDVKDKRRRPNQRLIPNRKDLIDIYNKYKFHAMELFVHFHDYYFTYAYQPLTYTISLWASWITVAEPYVRPNEYLLRTLATIACGTGLEPNEAFDNSKEIFVEGIEILRRAGIESPLFTKLLEIVEQDKTRQLFKPNYYLIDQVRLFFASQKIAEKIDMIDEDPFSEGSTSVDDYLANVTIYGEDDKKFISPIRYSLASLVNVLLDRIPVNDPQWLTAWNNLVISSQEVKWQ